MSILITGGTGFIGSRLSLLCKERGFNVRVLGQENTEAEKQNSKLLKEKGVEVILSSVSEIEKVSESFSGVDVVIHLAAAQHEMNIPDEKFREVNVNGTKNLVETSIKNRVKRFVYGSTIGVYGKLEGIIDEDSSCSPVNIYGKTKLEAEKLVQNYSDKIETVIIRIPETYGPGDRRLLKLFKGIKKNVFFIIGSGKNLHHPIFITDLAEGLILAASKNNAAGKTFLFAGKSAITTNEMVSAIAESLDKKNPWLKVPLFPMMFIAAVFEMIFRPLGIQPPLHRRRMDFFVKSYSFSIKRAEECLGFSPEHDFTDGTKITKRWYEEMKLL
jgi:nucleoside-diphosphate-sugar epimerase